MTFFSGPPCGSDECCGQSVLSGIIVLSLSFLFTSERTEWNIDDFAPKESAVVGTCIPQRDLRYSGCDHRSEYRFLADDEGDDK